MFCDARFTRIGVMDLTSMSNANSIFYGYRLGITIDKVIIKPDGSQTFANAFYDCGALENLTIEGVIGQNGFNVQWSTKLSHDSLMSILNALADKSTDTSGTQWIVTIGTENLAKLTDAEKRIAFQKGWDLA